MYFFENRTFVACFLFVLLYFLTIFILRPSFLKDKQHNSYQPHYILCFTLFMSIGLFVTLYYFDFSRQTNLPSVVIPQEFPPNQNILHKIWNKY